MDNHNPLPTAQAEQQQKVSPRELVMRYLPFLPWALASLAICLTLAWVKLRYSPDIYSVYGTILVRDQNSGNARQDKLDELLSADTRKNLNDEIQLVRSRNMGRRVVKSLGHQTLYFNKGKVRNSLIHISGSPIRLQVIRMRDSSQAMSIPVFIESDNTFRMEADGPVLNFGRPFETSSGSYILEKTDVDHRIFASKEFFVSYAPLESRAVEYVGGISASASGESNNIMMISYLTENTQHGIDVVNKWMEEYQQAGLEEKRQTAKYALRFIDDQMDTIRKDLGVVEKNLQGFREENQLYVPTTQAQGYLSNIASLDVQLTALGLKLENINFLIRYISDDQNPYRQVASLLGIDEPTLAAQISDFNKLQLERETLLKTTTAANPMVKNLETGIDKLRRDIQQNLVNVRQATQGAISSLQGKNTEAGRAIARIPVKEKQLLDITRRQKILEDLFSFLLQKKLETSISSASTISNIKVIEPAIATGPVSPNRSRSYLLAFLIGLGIPAAIIFLLEFLNDKVRSRDDIQRATQAPIIGEVGHSDQGQALVVSRTSRRFISEQFRIIRTNLEYVLPRTGTQTIIVTSSTSGEGKSFMSSNIGAVKALAGKKTVIMEFDIRKPKVAGSLAVRHKIGISNFVIGKARFEDIVVPVPNTENLFMIPCGPIPPNPSELLLDEQIGLLMARAKQEFEVVVIDTAPMGLVSDPVILGKYADATIYVIRHNHTFKKQLNMLNEIYLNKRLPHLSIVVNDIKADGGYGNYYGYGGYGYTGYGYGYGSEYFEDIKPAAKFLNKVFRFLRRQ